MYWCGFFSSLFLLFSAPEVFDFSSRASRAFSWHVLKLLLLLLFPWPLLMLCVSVFFSFFVFLVFLSFNIFLVVTNSQWHFKMFSFYHVKLLCVQTRIYVEINIRWMCVYVNTFFVWNEAIRLFLLAWNRCFPKKKKINWLLLACKSSNNIFTDAHLALSLANTFIFLVNLLSLYAGHEWIFECVRRHKQLENNKIS